MPENVTLNNDQSTFIQNLINAGRYPSVDDAVTVALELLKDREASLDHLRALIQEGLDSGPDVPLDVEKIKIEGRRRLASSR